MEIRPVNIVMTYPVHWTKYQVLRDFVQNFYDAAGHGLWRRSFCYGYDGGSLSMWLAGRTFNYEWLMHIGASTKTGSPEGYAGFFGEGFKIAALCALRDYGWNVQMASGGWHIEVAEAGEMIDSTPVKMLAYKISEVESKDETRLVLAGLSAGDYGLFKAVLDSFFSPDNPIMGETLWDGREGAVFLRSRAPINAELPVTRDYGRKGAVFCGYQMLGTNPFGLVVCLHRYRQKDRERRGLYAFDVIHVFEEVARHVSPGCAMAMLEKMRRYWNTYPHGNYDIHSWSGTVDALVRKVACSPGDASAFVRKYGNILCLRKVYGISEKNRRWQARAWLSRQEKKYILAKDAFLELGYPTLEDECEAHGGFVEDDGADGLQERCFMVLEDVCREVFAGFFEFDGVPERKIIANPRAAYHGMAVVHKKKKQLLNIKGIWIRYDVGKLYLKSEIFVADGYYDGLSTYVHEMCHSFGGDSSASFSQALTYSTELLMENHEAVVRGKGRWEQVFKEGSCLGGVRPA